MAACARLLRPAGRWCFITPRSWTNGSYFRAVRRHLSRHLRLDAVHLFESRTDHFEDGAVLQEAMVAWGTAAAAGDQAVLVSSSVGASDLDCIDAHEVPRTEFIRGSDLLISLASFRPCRRGWSRGTRRARRDGAKRERVPMTTPAGLPALPSLIEIKSRLDALFPTEFPDRSVLVGDMAARVVFVFLYGGFVEGGERLLRPSFIYFFTSGQARKAGDAHRLSWLADAARPGIRPSGKRWYADNSRESIRDD